MTFALLPSPLLGPASVAPLAERLAAADDVVVPRLQAVPEAPVDVLADLRRSLPAGVPLVLVPHSGAGLLVPALTAVLDVEAVVLVDAGLAPPEGSVAAAPERFRAFLQALAGEDGRLPPWSAWWGDDVAALFPDEPTRRAVEAEQLRLPLAYFAGRLPVPRGWDDRPCAYLAFGDAYAEERSAAARRGWPVRTLDGGHLHQLVDPDGVAAAVLALLEEARVRRRASG